MTSKNTSVADATNHAHAVDREQMSHSLGTLVNDVVDTALSAGLLLNPDGPWSVRGRRRCTGDRSGGKCLLDDRKIIFADA